MCNKSVNNYAHALEFVSECYQTQEVGHKVVNTYPSATQLVLDQFKTLETYDKAVGTCLWKFSDSETMNHARPMGWYNKFKQHNTLKNM